MKKRNDGPDSVWSLIGSVVGILIAAHVVVGLLAGLAHAGVLALVVLAALALASATAVGGHSAPLLGGWRLGGLWRRLRSRPKPLGGEARWGTLIDLWRAGWIGGTGWPIGVYRALGGLVPVQVRIPDDAISRSTLLLGPVGTGKTDAGVAVIVRSEGRIPDAAARHSLILLDPKGDVALKCQDALRTTHRWQVWNPSQSDRSTVAINTLGWIPTDPTDPHYQEACDNAARAYLAATYGDDVGLASSYAADPYWQRQTASVLKGIILYLKAFTPRLTLVDVARYIATVTPDEMVRHLTTHPRTAAAELRGATLRELLYNEKARGAIIGELTERVVLLTDRRLRRVIVPGALPSFDLDAFVQTPSVLVLQVGALGDPMLPLLSVAMSTIQTELVRRTRGGRQLSRGVRIVVDEAGVIGRIHGLDTGVAMLRSANVGYLITLQATEQLKVNYGEAKADIILRNLTHRLVLGGTRDTDAEWCCKNLGKRNAYRDLSSANGKGEESTHYTREEWPLLRPDQLQHGRFKVVVDSSDVPPLLLDLRHYKDHR